MVFEPSDGVGRLEAMKGADEILFSPGVAFHEFTRIVAIVSDIASTAAGDADLGENLGALLEDEDFWDSGFGCRDGTKEPGGSASDDDEFEGSVGHVSMRKPYLCESANVLGDGFHRLTEREAILFDGGTPMKIKIPLIIIAAIIGSILTVSLLLQSGSDKDLAESGAPECPVGRVEAVNNQWGFLVVGDVEASTFEARDSCQVMRDGKLLGEVVIVSMEKSKMIAEPCAGFDIGGIRAGDLVR